MEMVTLLILVPLLLIINMGIVVWFLRTSYRWDWSDVAISVLFSILAWVVLVVPIGFAVQFGDGLLPEYSVGYREGVIMKVSNKGIIWKTNEILLALGTDKVTAFLKPVQFSITDSDILKSANELVGERVTVHYNEWLLMPYRIGESGKQVTDITLN
jgi:hypothetical protein